MSVRKPAAPLGTRGEHPRLLFACDFPPSNLRGGTILIQRLLADWPADSLIVLTSRAYDNGASSAGQIDCDHIRFPLTNQTGRWGLGRLKIALNWLLIPVLAVFMLLLARRRRADAILSVAHGSFFLAAALASACARMPLLLIVHDDWTGFVEASALGPLAHWLFARTARQAKVIYAVSPQMQELLLCRYGLQSSLQMPARSAPAQPQPLSPTGPLRTIRVVYLGTLTGAVEDSIALTADVMNSEALHAYGLAQWRLDLYLPPPKEAPHALWASERVRFYPWVPQEEIDSILATADMLLLPFSFLPAQRFLTVRSFPSKAADYLAAARPILVIAPPDSTVAVYAAAQGFAEVVCAPDPAQIAAAIGRIAADEEQRARLSSAARATFEANHCIEQQRAELRADIWQAMARPATRSTVVQKPWR